MPIRVYPEFAEFFSDCPEGLFGPIGPQVVDFQGAEQDFGVLPDLYRVGAVLVVDVGQGARHQPVPGGGFAPGRSFRPCMARRWSTSHAMRARSAARPDSPSLVVTSVGITIRVHDLARVHPNHKTVHGTDPLTVELTVQQKVPFSTQTAGRQKGDRPVVVCLLDGAILRWQHRL